MNMYAPDMGAPKYIKQKLTERKGETDSDTVIAGNFGAPLATVNRSFRRDQ